MHPRRRFLGNALLGALAANTLSPVPAHSAEKVASQMKLGTVTYNLGMDWDIPTLIKNCEAAKFEGVELRTTHGHKVEVNLSKAERSEVKKRFENSRVDLMGLGSAFDYHTPDQGKLRKDIEATKEYIVLAEDVGAKGVKVRPNGLPKEVPVEKTLEQIGKTLRELGMFAKDHGQMIRLEVHGTGTSLLPNIKKIMEVADHSNVGVCWNSNQTDLDGEGFDHNFNLVKDKIVEVHMRDLFLEEYPFRKLLSRLNEINYSGFCLAEVPQSTDPVRVMKYYRGSMASLSGQVMSKLAPLAESISVMIGAFILGNAVFGFIKPSLSLNWWLLDLGRLEFLQFVMAFGFFPWHRFSNKATRVTGRISLGLVAWITFINGVTFYNLMISDRITPGIPLPLSWILTFFCIFVFWIRRSPLISKPSFKMCLISTTVLVLMFPFSLMLLYGKTDYSRKADVAVVFGARAYADGTPSDALRDRVMTGIALYRTGKVSFLLFSGGPGDGNIHETTAMTRLAIQEGIPAEALIVDTNGLNTAATVKNTRNLLPHAADWRIVAVSHFYHNPRVKMAFRKAGLETFTVPARESYFLAKTPYFIIREIAAFWVYALGFR